MAFPVEGTPQICGVSPGTPRIVLTPAVRARLEDYIERALAILDAADGDPDREEDVEEASLHPAVAPDRYPPRPGRAFVWPSPYAWPAPRPRPTPPALSIVGRDRP